MLKKKEVRAEEEMQKEGKRKDNWKRAGEEMWGEEKDEERKEESKESSTQHWVWKNLLPIDSLKPKWSQEP